MSKISDQSPHKNMQEAINEKLGYSDLCCKYASLQNEYKKLQAKNDELLNQLSEKEDQLNRYIDVTDCIPQLHEKNKQLEAEIERYKKDVSTKEAMLNQAELDLKVALSPKKKDTSIEDTFKVEINRIQKKNSDLQFHIESLNEVILDQSIEIEKLKKANARLRKTRQELTESNKKAYDAIEKSTRTLSQLKEERQNLSSTLEILKEELNISKEEFSRSQTELQTSETKIDSSSKVIETLEKLISSQQKELAEGSEERKRFLIVFQQLSEALTQYERYIKKANQRASEGADITQKLKLQIIEPSKLNIKIDGKIGDKLHDILHSCDLSNFDRIQGVIDELSNEIVGLEAALKESNEEFRKVKNVNHSNETKLDAVSEFVKEVRTVIEKESSNAAIRPGNITEYISKRLNEMEQSLKIEPTQTSEPRQKTIQRILENDMNASALIMSLFALNDRLHKEFILLKDASERADELDIFLCKHKMTSVNEMSDLLEGMSKEIESLKEKKQKIHSALKQTRIDVAAKESERLSKRIESLQAENEQLKVEIEANRSVINDIYSKSLSKDMNDVTEISSEKLNTKEGPSKLDRDVEDENIKMMLKQVSDYRMQLKAQADEIEHLNYELSKREAEITRIKSDYEAEIAEIERTNDAELEQANQLLIKSERKCRAYKQKIRKMALSHSEEIEFLGQQSAQELSALELEVSGRLDTEVSQLRESNEAAASELEGAKERINSLMMQIDCLISSKKALEDLLRERAAAAARLKGELEAQAAAAGVACGESFKKEVARVREDGERRRKALVDAAAPVASYYGFALEDEADMELVMRRARADLESLAVFRSEAVKL